jgi:hypothetical protein
MARVALQDCDVPGAVDDALSKIAWVRKLKGGMK